MRQEFAAWVFRQIDSDENWLSNVLWTNDAHFSLNGEFNIQNSRFWATENPRIFTEMPLYQPRVTVLCGFTSSFIIGPFFFEKSMEELLKPFLEKALSEITFMKVGGPPHISRGAKQLLKDTFGEIRGISRHIPVASKITRLDALRFLFMGVAEQPSDMKASCETSRITLTNKQSRTNISIVRKRRKTSSKILSSTDPVDRPHQGSLSRDTWSCVCTHVRVGSKGFHRCMETSEALHWTRQQQQKIDMDPEQQLYTLKIVDIATAVIEMYGNI
ncbi:hypothetical protein LAZ67_8000048 [Cordylochernes scorpioides]|uniref:Uncharacterized protein n=1 Tax=Cordylochernes scorpioides TaxID=51811 RepID=A0ABY6KRZ3_9ARAC|nr:hypothetical protein LAZ67_8000048 [Cordylochernes scorpioides]